MGKRSRPRRLRGNEAMAFSRMIRGSARKLNLVAQSIRGLPVERALNELAMSRRRVAGNVRAVLESAIANAEYNHQLDVDRLIVAEATTGRTMVMRRSRLRGRGRFNRIEKPFSNLTIVLREVEEEF